MAMRKKLIAGNWKMNKTQDEARAFCSKFVGLVKGVQDREITLLVPFVDLFVLQDALTKTNISYGAQNLFWEEKGAYTGEISAQMLVALGCKFVTVGHSERRQFFGETNETCNRKIKAAVKSGLVPIYCVGETLKQREDNQTFDVLKAQILEGLAGFNADFIRALVVAYEPVWAIGTGKNATAEQVGKAHAFIRDGIEKEFGTELANIMKILYGGSVTPDNARELLSLSDVDGALVGGASLDPEKFAKIVKFD